MAAGPGLVGVRSEAGRRNVSGGGVVWAVTEPAAIQWRAAGDLPSTSEPLRIPVNRWIGSALVPR